MSSKFGVNLYLAWFYLRGAETPLTYDDEFYHILHQFGKSINMVDMDSDQNVDSSAQSCYDFNQCEATFENLNDSMISTLESWMDEPKIHGDMEENYILIPLCSFGNQILENCSLFLPSKLTFQDDVCYTFDSNQLANIEPKFGLNLVLNINNIPQVEKPLLKISR